MNIKKINALRTELIDLLYESLTMDTIKINQMLHTKSYFPDTLNHKKVKL